MAEQWGAAGTWVAGALHNALAYLAAKYFPLAVPADPAIANELERVGHILLEGQLQARESAAASARQVEALQRQRPPDGGTCGPARRARAGTVCSILRGHHYRGGHPAAGGIRPKRPVRENLAT